MALVEASEKARRPNFGLRFSLANSIEEPSATPRSYPGAADETRKRPFFVDFPVNHHQLSPPFEAPAVINDSGTCDNHHSPV